MITTNNQLDMIEKLLREILDWAYADLEASSNTRSYDQAAQDKIRVSKIERVLVLLDGCRK